MKPLAELPTECGKVFVDRFCLGNSGPLTPTPNWDNIEDDIADSSYSDFCHTDDHIDENSCKEPIRWGDRFASYRRPLSIMQLYNESKELTLLGTTYNGATGDFKDTNHCKRHVLPVSPIEFGSITQAYGKLYYNCPLEGCGRSTGGIILNGIHCLPPNCYDLLEK